MKKLIFLFLSVIAAGSLFQACDNSKTYAEMLEDEKNVTVIGYHCVALENATVEDGAMIYPDTILH